MEKPDHIAAENYACRTKKPLKNFSDSTFIAHFKKHKAMDWFETALAALLCLD
jgi:hypothetical protein